MVSASVSCFLYGVYIGLNGSCLWGMMIVANVTDCAQVFVSVMGTV